MASTEETTPLFSEEERTAGYQEAPPSYDAVMREQTQPVVPSAPPASFIDQQPYQIDPYPPQPGSTDPNTTRATTTTTTTTYVTTTETRTRERSCCDCCPDTYCPGFIFCFYVPTPCPASCDCNCLPPTTHCCGGGCQLNNCGDCGGGDNDNPVAIIIILILLALFLVALIGIIAFLIYRLGDDKPPAVAKRYRVFAVVFAVIAYTIMIGAGIAVAIAYA